MATVMSMRWDGVTPAQYDAVRAALRWDEDPPAGLQMHAAWFDGDALHVMDLWESEQHWDTFLAERLGPAVGQAGMTGRPETRVLPAHRRYVAPGVTGAG
jgi:hypothetical protein